MLRITLFFFLVVFGLATAPALSLGMGVQTNLPSIQRHPPCDRLPGLADSYLLALSSQPAFCETFGFKAGKPECRKPALQSAREPHFSLHGLWPNQKACGIHYDFCGVASRKRHCSYAQLALSPPVSDALKSAMPSYAYGSCLERHEWFKHGSCQLLSKDAYFQLAIDLLNQANKTQLGQYIQQHPGQVIQRKKLKALIQEEFGASGKGKFHFSCRKGMLVEVHIRLPAHLCVNESLKSLVASATPSPKSDRCPRNIKISNFFSEVKAQQD